MTNKDLLYSTRNVTEYSVMAYMGKESKNSGYMCVCVYTRTYIYKTDSLCYKAETNTTL